MFVSGLPAANATAFAPQYSPTVYDPSGMGRAQAGFVPVDAWGQPVATTYGAMPTAFYPSAVQAVPMQGGYPAQAMYAAPYQQQAGLGSSMLDALADVLMPMHDAATGVAGAAGRAAGSLAHNTLAYVPTVDSTLANYLASTGRVARKAVSTAKRKGSELWAGVRNPRSIHITQVPSKWNPSPAAGNKDCGPASVVMALRLVGRKVPGLVQGAAPQRQIDRVRELAQRTSSRVSTTNWDLERALQKAGAGVSEVRDFASVRAAVMGGKPVILNGNPRHPGSYGHRYSASDMTPYNGAHWIVVSGFDEASGKFIVNDPLSKVGPVKITRGQLEAYRGGSLGIAVDG